MAFKLVDNKGAALVYRCGKCGQEAELPRSAVRQEDRQAMGTRFGLDRYHKCKHCGDLNDVIYDYREREQSPASSPKREVTMVSELRCPKCRSTDLHAGQKGFSLGKAAAGGLLLGGVGLLGGMIGSKKVMITCLKCGFKWQAGKAPAVKNTLPPVPQKTRNISVLESSEPASSDKIKILEKHFAEGKITKEQFENAKAELIEG